MHFFWSWDYWEKIFFFNPKMGCRWKYWQTTLGMFFMRSDFINLNRNWNYIVLLLCYGQFFKYYIYFFLFTLSVFQGKFPAFKSIEKDFMNEHFWYDFENSDYIFMRWKVFKFFPIFFFLFCVWGGVFFSYSWKRSYIIFIVDPFDSKFLHINKGYHIFRSIF